MFFFRTLSYGVRVLFGMAVNFTIRPVSCIIISRYFTSRICALSSLSIGSSPFDILSSSSLLSRFLVLTFRNWVEVILILVFWLFCAIICISDAFSSLFTKYRIFLALGTVQNMEEKRCPSYRVLDVLSGGRSHVLRSRSVLLLRYRVGYTERLSILIGETGKSF